MDVVYGESAEAVALNLLRMVMLAEGRITDTRIKADKNWIILRTYSNCLHTVRSDAGGQAAKGSSGRGSRDR